MDAEVVVFRAAAQIAGALDAPCRNRRHERPRQNLHVAVLLHERVRPALDFREERRLDLFVGCCAARNRAQRSVQGARERDGVDVVDVEAAAGNHELPARGDGVVARVLRRVAPALQRGDDDIVVRVLREAEPLGGELRAETVDLDRRVPVDAQVDLRVDELELAARLQTQAREVVERRRAVAREAAEHHRLSVVALLDADVEVAVAVARDEELLQQLQRAVAVEPTRRKVGLVVGQQILVNAAETAMVFALAPHRVVQDAERLERLAEGARTEARDAPERLGDVVEPASLGGGAVALDEAEHGLDRENGVFEEFDALRVSLGAGAGEAVAHLRETRVEAVADRGTEVGGEVEDDALLAERRAGGAAGVHLFLRVQLGDLADSSRERDSLAVEEYGVLALGAEHLLQPDAGARPVGRALRDEPREQRRPVGVAPQRVLPAVERVVEEPFDSRCHGFVLRSVTGPKRPLAWLSRSKRRWRAS